MWCAYGNINHQYNVSPFHLHAHLYVGNFTKWFALVSTAYEVVRDCRKFEKHWSMVLRDYVLVQEIV
jgi:hypothetical protein